MAINNLSLQDKQNLALSGSSIATERKNIVFEANQKDATTGFIYGPGKTQDYNIPALERAIDTEITELIPISEEEELNLVPRPLYEDALDALAIAEETIEVQAQTITNLENRISELESQVEELSAELDNEQLLRVISEANSENLREQLALINESSQTSLQRSVLEGIQRAGLEAKVSGLESEVSALKDELISLQQEKDSLEKLLAGKDAQIEAGAKTSTELTVNVLNKQDEESEDLVLDSISWNYSLPDETKYAKPYERWINGPTLELYNPTSVPQNITFDISKVSGNWINSIPQLTLAAGQKTEISISFNRSNIVPLRPTNRAAAVQNYRGSIVVKTNTTSLSLSTRLYKHTKR